MISGNTGDHRVLIGTISSNQRDRLVTAPVLVFGAAGKFAGEIVPALVRRGATVRGFVRNDEDAAAARKIGATEAALGDLADADSVATALKGVERVFYIAPAFMDDEAEIGVRIVGQCVDAGVQRVVFSSVIHPVLSGLSNHAAKAPVEEALIDSGMPYVLLHPGLFFQDYAASWAKIAETGNIAEPWSCDTRFSRVDYRDVAEVAASALVDDDLLWGTFELCADGWHDRHDVARLAGDALGRAITAATIDPDTLGEAAARMRPMFGHYDRTGLRGSPVTLRAILAREPRSLANYFAELAAVERP